MFARFHISPSREFKDVSFFPLRGVEARPHSWPWVAKIKVNFSPEKINNHHDGDGNEYDDDDDLKRDSFADNIHPPRREKKSSGLWRGSYCRQVGLR